MYSTTNRLLLAVFIAVVSTGFLLFSEPGSNKQKLSQVRDGQSLRETPSSRYLQGMIHEYSDIKPTNAPTFEFEKLISLETPAIESSHASVTVTLIDLVPRGEPSMTSIRPRAIRTDNRLYPLLPDYSFIYVEDANSAQAHAYSWTIHHPQLPTLDEWRILQLFSISTFYFSLMKNGEPKVLEGSIFLNYSLHECDWGADGLPVNTTILCGLGGRIQRIALRTNNTNMTRKALHLMPAEISLMTSLEGIDFSMTGIEVSFRELLPTSLRQLSNFTYLSFPFNEIQGSIPDDLSMTLPGLRKLNLEGNSVNGTIPKTIGLLSNLTSLSLGENNLVGTLPSELGLLQELTSLTVSNNNLSGDIPTEIQNLHKIISLNLSGNNFTESSFIGLCDLIPTSAKCRNASPIVSGAETELMVKSAPPLPLPVSTAESFAETDQWVGY